MVVNTIQEVAAWSSSMAHYGNSVAQALWKLPINSIVLAQHIDSPDLLGNVQKAFDHFVQSGQIWALLIGLILGYMIRGLTSYG